MNNNVNEDIIDTIDQRTKKEQNKEKVLVIIIFILLFLLLLIGFGYLIYVKDYSIKHNNEVNSSGIKADVEEYKPREEVKYESINGESSTIIASKIKNVLSILNNRYKEESSDKLGYIYKRDYIKDDFNSNDYVIFTAINYLTNRNELESNSDSTYNKKVSVDKVNEVVKSIFGDILYNNEDFTNRDYICPSIKYEDGYYYVNTTCTKSDIYIDTYVYKIVEKTTRIEMYQSVAYEKNNEKEFGIYKDSNLTNKVTDDRNFELNIVNYNNFDKYKFVFVKGNDGNFYFDSIEKAE